VSGTRNKLQKEQRRQTKYLTETRDDEQSMTYFCRF
jgi:hypothetical protein